MFKRPDISNQKLIRKSAYAIAMLFPFISLFGETKASKIISNENEVFIENKLTESLKFKHQSNNCLLYTSPSPRDATLSRMPSSA